VINGFLAEQDPQVVVLRGLDGQNVSLPRGQIADMKNAGVSLMPEGLLDAFNDSRCATSLPISARRSRLPGAKVSAATARRARVIHVALVGTPTARRPQFLPSTAKRESRIPTFIAFSRSLPAIKSVVGSFPLVAWHVSPQTNA